MAKLKTRYAKLDEIDEPYRELYAERDGAFLLDVEGLKTQTDVDKVLGDLRKERDATKAVRERFASFREALGLDENATAEQVVELHTELETLRAKGGDKLPDADKLELSTLRREKTKLERELKKATDEFTAASTERESLRKEKVVNAIRDRLRGAAVKLKVLETAVEDVLDIGSSRFELTDDLSVVARGTGVGVEDWILDQQARRPHWWGDSRGGLDDKKKGGSTTKKWNDMSLGERGELFRTNRQRAIEAARAAGDTLALESMGAA